MAKEKKEKEPKPEGEEGKKGGKKKLIIIGVAVLAVVGVGAGLSMGGSAPKKGAKGAAVTTTTVAAPELGVVSLDKVTVSLADNSLVQFEVGVRVVNKKPDKKEIPPAFVKDFKPDAFKAADGVIARDAASEAVRAFSHQQLLSSEGQSQASDAIKKAVIAAYHGYVDEVYVVGFIVQ